MSSSTPTPTPTPTKVQVQAHSQPGHRTDLLSKYERTKVIGMRAEQLARGAQPFVEVDGATFDPCEVAERELRMRKLPFVIVRPGPDGKSEHIKLETLGV